MGIFTIIYFTTDLFISSLRALKHKEWAASSERTGDQKKFLRSLEHNKNYHSSQIKAKNKAIGKP